MSIPRIIIAGTNSGCGKTTITSGILAALTKRGLNVQPYKAGPDYIDPMFHTFITGNPSRNLDSWMLDENAISRLFSKNAAGKDIAVIEGVMGLYDGFGGRSQIGSTAHLSKILGAPVVLVVNPDGMALSVAALIQGFRDFDRNVPVRGVILNNIEESYYLFLKEIIAENTGLKVLGYLPKVPEFSLKSRHLGLIPSDEVENLRGKMDMLAEKLEKTLDLDLLIETAKEYRPWLRGRYPEAERPVSAVPEVQKGTLEDKVRIGVAKDRAFNFYYQDNLDLLEELGAELVFFSPLSDSVLPENIDGLYIGGGYPEIFAKELQENTPMKQSIRSAVEDGLPVYAECGGFMYLTGCIKDREGNEFEMVGIIPGKSEMTSSLKRFGYVEIEVSEDNILARKGARIRGHEFHYSTTDVEPGVPASYRVIKPRCGKENITWSCGFKLNNLLAGYPHIHFWANPEFAREFISGCRRIAAQKRA